MNKNIICTIAAVLLTATSFAQSSKQNARLKEIRELYSTTQNTIKDMTESNATNCYFNGDAVVNESAVGPVKYHYNYWPTASYNPEAGDFIRLQRTVTVNPADVYEILYNSDGTPAFYFLMERSYHDEGCHTDYRIYWDADGKTVTHMTCEEVSADGSKKAVTLDKDRKKSVVESAYKYATSSIEKCAPFFNTVANEESEGFEEE